MLKRLAIFGGGAVIVAAILVAACYQQRNAVGKGYDIKCAQSSEPTAISASLACEIHPSQYTEQGHSKSHWWDVLIAWPEGITTWLLLLTLGAIVWQAWETRNAAKATEIAADAALESAQAGNAQIKAMKDKERARLVIRHVENPEIGAPEHLFEGHRPLWVRFFVENIGQSKAFNVRAQGVVILVSDPEKGLHENGFFQDFPQIIDEGSGRHRLSLAGFGVEFDDVASTADFQTIPEEVATQIREGKTFIQASGLLTYDDIFNDPHRTPFRLAWKSRGDDDGGKWLTRSVWVDYSPAST